MIPGSGTPGRFAIGQISDGTNASAAGVIIACNASIIAGAASGAANAAGDDLAAIVSLLPGEATGTSGFNRAPGIGGFVKRPRPEPESAFAAGAEIKVFAWIEAGIATGEIVPPSGKPTITASIPEPPPTVLTFVGFGDGATSSEFIERLLLDHSSPGRNFVRYQNDTSGRRENKLVRTIRDRSEVLVSYEGFNFDDESDRELLDTLALAD